MEKPNCSKCGWIGPNVYRNFCQQCADIYLDSIRKKDENTDSMRLDWMIENHNAVNFIDQHSGFGLYLRIPGRVLSNSHKTPREAIDAAMKAERGSNESGA